MFIEGSRPAIGEGYIRPSRLRRIVGDWGAPLAWLAFAFAFGAFLPRFLMLVRTWGFRIPNPAVELDYVVGLCWALLILCSILFWPVPQRDKPALLVLWSAKIGVTLGVMLLYEWNYPLDAFFYFEESFGIRPLEFGGRSGGSDRFINLVRLHSTFLPDSYHAMKVTCALAGLIGVYFLYRGAVAVMQREDQRLLYFLGLYPSILFWSSILGKDPIQMLGFMVYAYGVMKLQASKHSIYVAPIVVGILISSYIRVWGGLIMLAPLLVFFIRGLNSWVKRITFFGGSVALMGWQGQRFFNAFGIYSVADVYRQLDDLSLGWVGGSSQQRTLEIDSLSSVIQFLPTGIFTALFRPLPGEVMNPFGLVAGLENFFLLVLLAVALFRLTRAKLGEPVVQWGIAFVLVWASLYGFVSYNNMGAAARFKLQVLPILVWLLIYLSRHSPVEEGSDADGGEGVGEGGGYGSGYPVRAAG